MSGFQRVESKFAPIPDGVYTQYAVEATFIISSNKGTPGVNYKMKINEMDENGQPQAHAGKSFYLTKYLTENTIGDFCKLIDLMGYKVDAEGYYVLADGSRMPDFFKMQDKETISFLIGLPFVGKLSSSDNEYTDNQGEKKESIQYNVRPNWVIPAEGGRKVMQMSVHPSKVAVFAMASVPAGVPATPGTAVPQQAGTTFANSRGF